MAAVLVLAAGLRLAGLDWDGGAFAHPDERRILMVVEGLQWPRPWDWGLVLSPSSPLNPRFFAYGSFPLYLLRLLGALTGSRPAELYLPGRALSAVFDLLTVAAVYGIGRELGETARTSLGVRGEREGSAAGRGRAVGLAAAALYACSVLSIQLAHFLTVDSLLTLLTTLTVWCLMRVARSGRLRAGLAAGALTGLALATKTSALPLVFTGWVAWALWCGVFGRPGRGRGGLNHEAHEGAQAAGGETLEVLKTSEVRAGLNHEAHEGAGAGGGETSEVWAVGARGLWRGLAGLALSTLACGLAFAAAEPYAIIDWFRFGVSLAQEGGMASGAIDLPYTRQFLGTPAYLYQVRELVVWSLGAPLGLTALAGLGWFTWRVLRAGLEARRAGEAGIESRPTVPVRAGVVVLAWVWPYLLASGGLQAKFSRYMAPVIPWLCVMAALLLWRLWERAGGAGMERAGMESRPTGARRLAAGLGAGVWAATLLYALAFTGMYLRPHPWVAASAWLREHVPAGAVLTSEVWDDRLPIGGAGDARAPVYGYVDLDVWAVDEGAGLEALAGALSQADYVVVASQRLYGAIGRLPERYPLAAAYYRLLFGEELGFYLTHVEASYPRLGPLAIVDEPLAGTVLPRPALPRPAPIVVTAGRADESYAVYDHPRVLIFRNAAGLAAEELKARIEAAAALPGP